MKAVFIWVAAIIAICSSIAFAKGTPKETVMVVDHESSTTSYDWVMDGRVSVSCYGYACSGYYTAPTSGTQMIQGAILKLQRSDSSIVIAQCVAKVDIFSSIVMVVDAVNANDPHAPTVYRNCRIPYSSFTLEAQFHRDTVKLFWQANGSDRDTSETYAIVGYLQPTVSQRAAPVSAKSNQGYLPSPDFHSAIPSPSVPAKSSAASLQPAPPVPPVPAKSSLAGLKTFRYPDEGFSISFPAEPQIDPEAKNFKLRSYIAPDSSVSLFMGVSNKDSHHPHSDPKILYETAENHFLHVSDSRLLKDQRITLGIYPGIEFESESDSEALHFSVRVYLVGNTVYQMSVSTPIGEPCAEATRFLDSFQLIPRLSN